MASYIPAVAFFAVALSMSSLLGVDAHFVVEGQVYCDTCRAQFITKLSQYMEGAKVRLECRKREGGEVTYSVDGETDESGTYRLSVDGDHEDEECGVVLLKSNKPGCDETKDVGDWAKTSSKISLTDKNGMTTSLRHANPLGFLKKEALKECPQVFKEMGMIPHEVETTNP